MHAARDIEITGQAASRLIFNELTAIAGLADAFVAGRNVDEQGRARECLVRAGRYGDPKVFANLDADNKAGDRLCGVEKQIRAEGDILASQMQGLVTGEDTRREPTALVKLLVIGQVG